MKVAQSVVVSKLDHPLVEAGDCFIVAPTHDFTRELDRELTGNHWKGPYSTKEKAQRAAARMVMQTGWGSAGVFKLVGTVTKPIPDLAWHEVVEGAPNETAK